MHIFLNCLLFWYTCTTVVVVTSFHLGEIENEVYGRDMEMELDDSDEEYYDYGEDGSGNDISGEYFYFPDHEFFNDYHKQEIQQTIKYQKLLPAKVQVNETDINYTNYVGHPDIGREIQLDAVYIQPRHKFYFVCYRRQTKSKILPYRDVLAEIKTSRAAK